MRQTVLLAILAAGLAGCSTSEIVVPHTVRLVSPASPYPEAQLLDVGVVLFDAGVPQGEIDRDLLEELMRDGTYVSIRRAESIMLAVTLSDTLQASGNWGSVWVTPRVSNAADLNVSAEILQSDGDILKLHVKAMDAGGKIWLDDDYDMETAASAYNRQRYPNLDPYQDVFNEIANDLAAIRMQMAPEQVANIRSVAELRYANELSPEAFDGYVEKQNNGSYEIVRLPATNDPMLDRTRSVRQRERIFFETLDQYYSEFELEASDSYNGWREFSREDAIELQEAARAAKMRTGLGALAIALSIAYGNNHNDSMADRVLANAGMYIGGDLLRAGAVRRQERRLYTQNLRELSESFEDDVKPLVVEIEGTQHRLTGTADAQYEEWRRLLQGLFISETGFAPEDIEVYAEPAQESDVQAAPASDEQAAPESDAQAAPDTLPAVAPGTEAPATTPNSASNPDPEGNTQEATQNASGGTEAAA
jgi:hypothetical protein